MANGFTITLVRDDVTKDLQKLMRKVKTRTPLMRAIGVGMVGLAKDAFSNASLRPQPWRPKKDGSAATLRSREATLWRSLRVQTVSNTNVSFGSDRPYAAIHQLGGKTRPMPARPYFPIWQDKLTDRAAKRTRDIIETYMQVRGSN